MEEQPADLGAGINPVLASTSGAVSHSPATALSQLASQLASQQPANVFVRCGCGCFDLVDAPEISFQAWTVRSSFRLGQPLI
jgi:hypothetical protein